MRTFVISLFLVVISLSTQAQKPITIEAADFSTAIKSGKLLPIEKAAREAQCIIIKNNIRCDVDYTFAAGSEIQLESGVRLIIPTKRALALEGTWLHGNKELWRGISVENQGIITIKNGNIEDALYAVEVQSRCLVKIDATTFNRNYIGILIPPNPLGNSILIGTFNDNIFDCTSPMLPGYSGQKDYAGLPLVSGPKSYAGMEMHQQSAFVIPTNPALQNTFRNLRNGIVAFRSTLNIQRTAFINILPTLISPTPIEGNGVYADGTGVGNGVVIIGFGFGFGATPSFDNCRNGITSIGNKLRVAKNNMINIQNTAVEISGSQYLAAAITSNSIQSLWAGIRSLLNEPFTLDINANTINVGAAGSPADVRAIDVQGSGNINTSTSIALNKIDIFRQGWGINMQAHFGGALCDINTNKIYFDFVNPSSFDRIGINLNGCRNLLVRCNEIKPLAPGTAHKANLSALVVADTRNSVYSCNLMSRTEYGATFAGDCSGGTAFRGNQFRTHYVGLMYYQGTAMPAQANQGNRWYGNYTGGPNAAGAWHQGGGGGSY